MTIFTFCVVASTPQDVSPIQLANNEVSVILHPFFIFLENVFLIQNLPRPQLASINAQEMEDKIQTRGNVIQALASLPVSSFQDAALISSALAQSTVRLSTIKAYGQYSINQH